MRSCLCAAILAFGLAVCACSAYATSQVTTLGSGYVCVGKSVKYKGRILPFKNASSTLKSLIASQRSKLAALKKKKAKPAAIAKAQAALDKLKALTPLLKSCSQGTLSGVAPIWSALAGNYPNGSFTFSDTDGNPVLTGPMSALFALNGTIVSGNLSISGDVFNAVFSNNRPIPFQFDAAAIVFPFKLEVPGTVLGDMTFVFTADGHISADAVNPPQNDLNKLLNLTKTSFEASLVGTSLQGTISLYSGTVATPIATGQFTLTR